MYEMYTITLLNLARTKLLAIIAILCSACLLISISVKIQQINY